MQQNGALQPTITPSSTSRALTTVTSTIIAEVFLVLNLLRFLSFLFQNSASLHVLFAIHILNDDFYDLTDIESAVHSIVSPWSLKNLGFFKNHIDPNPFINNPQTES